MYVKGYGRGMVMTECGFVASRPFGEDIFEPEKRGCVL